MNVWFSVQGGEYQMDPDSNPAHDDFILKLMAY
jgi:hypothetical protein